jgi:pilus assembly protein CpaB
MLALGCGLVASIGITQVIANKNSGSESGKTEMAAIFVAKEDIPTLDLITAEVLKLEEWPKDKIPAGALTDIKDVESRRPKSKIYAGSPVLDNQLLSKGQSGSGAAPQIPAGYRVVSVMVDKESGTSDLIRPGDRVDVLLFMQKDQRKGISDTCVRAFLQDIKVFAVNDIFDFETMEGDRSISAKTISLLVKPAQASQVMLATQLGKIRLALRSHEDKLLAEIPPAYPRELDQAEQASRSDEDLVKVSPADMEEFRRSLSDQAIPEPARNTWTVRMIEGPQVNDLVLEEGVELSNAGFGRSWKLLSPRPGGSAKAEASDGSGTQQEGEAEAEAAEGASPPRAA